MFGQSSANKPTLSLFGGNTSTNQNNNAAPTGSTSLFGKPLGQSTTQNQPSGSGFSLNLGQSTNNQQQQQQQQSNQLQQQQQQNQSSQYGQQATAPQIDLAHLRSTTKFDHLQASLQQEITNLDNAILNQQAACAQLSDLLRSVTHSGPQLAPAIDYITTKHEELESGLENDAESIVSFRDTELKRDENEVKCVFRAVDRLKVPRQYQVIEQSGGVGGVGTTSILGAASTLNTSTGLSGWWNQPQTHRGVRSTPGIGGQSSLQLVSEDIDDGSTSGPKTLIDLFDGRAEDFTRINAEQKRLLTEIEDFVEGLEEKVLFKEREINERLNYGNANATERREEEKERNMNQLRFVFGEVQRGLFDVAEKVSTTRDGVTELGMLR